MSHWMSGILLVPWTVGPVLTMRSCCLQDRNVLLPPSPSRCPIGYLVSSWCCGLWVLYWRCTLVSGAILFCQGNVRRRVSWLCSIQETQLTGSPPLVSCDWRLRSDSTLRSQALSSSCSSGSPPSSSLARLRCDVSQLPCSPCPHGQ